MRGKNTNQTRPKRVTHPNIRAHPNRHAVNYRPRWFPASLPRKFLASVFAEDSCNPAGAANRKLRHDQNQRIDASLTFFRLAAEFGVLEDLCNERITVQQAVVRLLAKQCDGGLIERVSDTAGAAEACAALLEEARCRVLNSRFLGSLLCGSRIDQPRITQMRLPWVDRTLCILMAVAQSNSLAAVMQWDSLPPVPSSSVDQFFLRPDRVEQWLAEALTQHLGLGASQVLSCLSRFNEAGQPGREPVHAEGCCGRDQPAQPDEDGDVTDVFLLEKLPCDECFAALLQRAVQRKASVLVIVLKTWPHLFYAACGVPLGEMTTLTAGPRTICLSTSWKQRRLPQQLVLSGPPTAMQRVVLDQAALGARLQQVERADVRLGQSGPLDDPRLRRTQQLMLRLLVALLDGSAEALTSEQHVHIARYGTRRGFFIMPDAMVALPSVAGSAAGGSASASSAVAGASVEECVGCEECEGVDEADGADEADEADEAEVESQVEVELAVVAMLPWEVAAEVAELAVGA